MDEEFNLAYRKLWCNVIACAIDDARGTAKYLKMRRVKRDLVQQEAKDWLDEKDAQFDSICDHLGINSSLIWQGSHREDSRSMENYMNSENRKSGAARRIDEN